MGTIIAASALGVRFCDSIDEYEWPTIEVPTEPPRIS
jgi:hypothetical protein